MSRKPYKVFRCEQDSPTINKFKTSKNNGKIITMNNNSYQRIGDDYLYCFKTSCIIKFGSLELDSYIKI